MNKLIKKLLSFKTLVTTDKLLRFFYGSIIATPIVIWGTTMEALVFMIFISIGKEVVNVKIRFIAPSVMDLIFTLLPTLLLLAVKLIN